MTVVLKLKYILKLSFTNNSVRGLRSQFDKDENSISNSLRLVCLTAQFGGIMPLSDIETRGKFPKFEWRSSRTLYAFVRFAGSILLASIHIHKMSETALTLQKMRILLFFMSGLVTSVNFFILARKWPLLIRKIHVVDLEISKIQEKSNLRKTVRIAFLIYMLVAASEYLEKKSATDNWKYL
ncbi:gustatory receptor for sugar taste 64e-like [Coccinella septempunctata]|uniref:gustatory receptor for sugar taste 64e-like n=1 Tax=Coccinella septempunctata TaxID=41139 RepID=UPI001D0733D0|nr:gustatory receptor for sugar taste 64e-like [Coccinella septempunctata]